MSWTLPSRLRPRPRLCSALDPEAQPQLQALSERLQAFYNDSAVAAGYFEAAERTNPTWTPKMTGHWRLKQTIPPGSRVVDLGCGTAHPCRNLEDRDVRYTGVDWSTPQIDRNRERMPNHEFVAGSLYRTSLSAGSFDAAISLYTIEHLCWPHLLLEEMIRLVRPGDSSPFSRLRFANALRSSPSTTVSARVPSRTRSARSDGWMPRSTCTSTGLRTPGFSAGIIPSTRPSTVFWSTSTPSVCNPGPGSRTLTRSI